MNELQRLEGIGDILSRRLVESGDNSIAKIAAAEKSGLERIAGMNAHKVWALVAQARQITGEAEKHKHTWVENNHTR